MTEPTNGTPPANPTPPAVPNPENWVQKIRMKSAAVIVGIFLLTQGVIVAKILGLTKAIPEDIWNQLMIPVTSIETLATAAAGVLLGVSVQQSNVETASKRAEEAQLAKAEAQKKLGIAKDAAANAAEELAPSGGSSERGMTLQSLSDTDLDRIDRAQRHLRKAMKA